MDDTELPVTTPGEEKRQRELVQAWLRRHLKEFTIVHETIGRNPGEILQELLRENASRETYQGSCEAYFAAHSTIGRYMGELRSRQLWCALDELAQAMERPDYHLPPRNTDSPPETERSLFIVEPEKILGVVLPWIMEVPWSMLQTYQTHTARGITRQRDFFTLPGARLTRILFSDVCLPSLETILAQHPSLRPGEDLLQACYEDIQKGLVLPGQGLALSYGQWPIALNVGRDCLMESTYHAGKNPAGEKQSITTMQLSTEHFRVYGHQFAFTAPGRSDDLLKEYSEQQRSRIGVWEFLLPHVPSASIIGLFPKKEEYDHWASKFPEFVCCADCKNDFGAIVFESTDDAEEFQVYREGKKKDPSLPFRVLFG